MNKQQLVVLLLAIVGFYNGGEAQVSVKGVVRSRTDSSAVPYAEVNIYGGEGVMKKTSTDVNGKFSLSDFKEVSEYKIEIVSLGFKNYSLFVNNPDKNKHSTKDLGDIYLETLANSLETVTVQAQSKNREIDRIVIYPNEKQKKASSNAWNLLERINIPTAIVDKQDMSFKTLDGKPVLFRIDGVPASVRDLLSVQPDQVLRIDYIDHPGARYADQDIGAILDMKVRRPISGVSAGVYSSGALTTRSLYNEAYLKFNKGAGEFSLNYENKYRYYDDCEKSTSLRLSDADSTKIFEKRGLRSPYGYMEHNIGSVYYYYAGDFLLNAKFNDRIYDSSHHQHYRQAVYENDLPVFNTYTDPVSRTNSPSLDLYSEMNFHDKGTLLADVLGTYMDNRYGYLYGEFDPYGQKSDSFGYHVRGKKYSLISEGMYERRIKNVKWSAGIKYSLSRTENAYTGDLSTKFKALSSDLYVYVQAMGSIGKINYRLGLGTNADRYREEGNRYRKLFFRPLFRIAYHPEDAVQITYDLSVNTINPSLSSMTKVSRWLNSYEVRSGNTDLRPYRKFNHEWSAVYNKGRVYAQLSYRLSTAWHPFAPYAYLSKNPMIAYYTDIRYRNSFEGAARAYVSYDILPDKLTLTSYLAKEDSRYKQEEGNAYRLSDWSWGAKLSLNLGYFSLSLREDRTPKQLSGAEISYNESMRSFDLSYKKRNCMFQIGLWNPFKHSLLSSGYSYNVQGIQKTEAFRMRDDVNMLNLSISWDVNYGRRYKAINKKVNNSDTKDGIVK